MEKSTSRQSWRHPDTHIAFYLRQIADWGYALSPVEKIAAKLAEANVGVTETA